VTTADLVYFMQGIEELHGQALLGSMSLLVITTSTGSSVAHHPGAPPPWQNVSLGQLYWSAAKYALLEVRGVRVLLRLSHS
jgi:hypothetical protein